MWWKLCPFNYGSECVTLSSEKEDGASITTINEYGVYEVVVEEKDNKVNGSMVKLTIAANALRGGSIFTAVAITGAFGERLTITWDKGQVHPKLKYMNKPSGDDVPKSQTFRVVYKKTG